MKKILSLFCLLAFCISSCKQVNPSPVTAAKEFCEEMAIYEATNDLDKANDCLKRYWDAFSKTDHQLNVFCMALRDELRSSKFNHVGIFIGNIDDEKYPLFKDFKARFIATCEILDRSALENAIKYVGKISLFDGFGEGLMTYDLESNEVQLVLKTKSPVEGVQNIDRQLAIEGLRIALSRDSYLLNLMTDANASFSMWYSDSSQQFKVASFSPSEIEDIINNPIPEKERRDKLLENYVAKTNSVLPNEVAEGVTYLKVEIKGDYIVQTYRIDNQLYNIDEIREDLYSHKYDAAIDPIERNEYDIYVSHGKGLRIEYYAKSTMPVIIIEYSTEELKRLLE